MPTVPRVRDTLQITRLDMEESEVTEYSIRDREGQELGRVTEEGYFLLLQMDGLTEVDQVCDRIHERFGKTSSREDLTAWFEELRGAGVLNTDDRAIRVLTYLREQGIQYRGSSVNRRGAASPARAEDDRDEDTRRDDTNPVAGWFDYAIFLLNDGMLDRSQEVFKRMIEMAPSDVRIREIAKHLDFLAASEKLPDLEADRRDVSWDAFDAALSDMLSSGTCPHCKLPFEVELGAINRCQGCGASFSSYVLDKASDNRRSAPHHRDTA